MASVDAAQAAAIASSPDPTTVGNAAYSVTSAERMKECKTMTELAKDSTIIVRGVALDHATTDRIGTVPFVAREVKVSESFRGSAMGNVIKVREIGGPRSSYPEAFPPALKPGNEYILYLAPSGLRSKADQYGVTGGAGEFRYHADGTADRLDDESGKLPQQITAATVRRSIADAD